MSLDLSSLRDALGARNASLGYLDSDLATDPGLRDQFRAAAEAGLVGDVSQFHAYRETRNITSHSYNRQKAERITSPTVRSASWARASQGGPSPSPISTSSSWETNRSICGR